MSSAGAAVAAETAARDAIAMPAQAQCHQCGTALVGAYCHACGQPSTVVSRSFAEAMYGQTGRLLRSLWLLIARPGELAREIDEARDRRSLRPGAMLANLIAFFFVVAGGLGGFSAQDLIRQDPSGRVAAITQQRSAARGLGDAVFAERLESRFRSAYSILITLSAFAYAFAFWLLERRRGKPWLVHIAAAVQYMCITFLLSAVALGAARLIGGGVAEHPAFGIGTVVLLALYIVLLLRRVYGDSPGMAVLKMLVVLAIGAACDSILAMSSFAVALYTA